MDARSNVPVADPPGPLPFLVATAFASSLIWLWAVLSSLPQW
jgi:hypothetical protein